MFWWSMMVSQPSCFGICLDVILSPGLLETLFGSTFGLMGFLLHPFGFQPCSRQHDGLVFYRYGILTCLWMFHYLEPLLSDPALLIRKVLELLFPLVVVLDELVDAHKG